MLFELIQPSVCVHNYNKFELCHRQKVELAQREFKCEECRIEINRDLNSAMNMLKIVEVDCS
ncbi:MAG: hypothetical protein DRP33_03720 [Thermotogae bacterium]|nr:MAG: hypothetical protein DRP33_03720 [Thermotogota bacterium]